MLRPTRRSEQQGRIVGIAPHARLGALIVLPRRSRDPQRARRNRAIAAIGHERHVFGHPEARHAGVATVSRLASPWITRAATLCYKQRLDLTIVVAFVENDVRNAKVVASIDRSRQQPMLAARNQQQSGRRASRKWRTLMTRGHYAP